MTGAGVRGVRPTFQDSRLIIKTFEDKSLLTLVNMTDDDRKYIETRRVSRKTREQRKETIEQSRTTF